MLNVTANETLGPTSLGPLVPSSWQALLKAMRCDEPGGSGKSRYATWYIKFLRHRVSLMAPDILAAIGGADLDSAAGPRPNDIAQRLVCIVEVLDEQQNPPLAQFIETLRQRQLLSSDTSLNSLGAQFTFIAIGLLTMLYSPSLQPNSDCLELAPPTTSIQQDTWPLQSIELSSKINSSIASVIRGFGAYRGPIPDSKLLSEDDQMPGGNNLSRTLVSANVSFYTLKKLVGINIVWVSSACEHLELDVGTKTLKLFRYPSFCGMVCVAEPKHTQSPFTEPGAPGLSYLSQLFRDYSSRGIFGQDSDANSISPSAFYREILMSYRIIFGQDRKSWKEFASGKAFPARGSGDFDDGDPLLVELCGRDWIRQQVYKDVFAGPAKFVYPVYYDFPHFAERLVALQDFVVTQSPNDFWSLLSDRRDMNRLWTIRAAVLLGGVGVLFAIVQTLLSIVQVVAAFTARST